MGSKNGIEWNRIKKFMQVDVDEICMCTNFGGCCFSGFRDIATFKEERERGMGDGGGGEKGIYICFLLESSDLSQESTFTVREFSIFYIIIINFFLFLFY